jgi:plasmid stabilization system protein ParE
LLARVDEPPDPPPRRGRDREVDYYEARQPGLGAELEEEIEAVFALILRFPEAAPQWRDRPDRRVAVLERFPFTIPYQIKYDDIVVLALAHTSRRPGYWSQRGS